MTINIFFQQKSRYRLIAKMILLNSKQILIQRFSISYRRRIVNFRNKNRRSSRYPYIRLIIITVKKRITLITEYRFNVDNSIDSIFHIARGC